MKVESPFDRLSIKLADYHTHNQSRIKLVLDICEFIIVIYSIAISYFIVRKFVNPFAVVIPLELIVFSFLLLVSWFIISRITAVAIIQDTAIPDIIFQFIQNNFIVLTGLLLVRFIFRFNSVPVSFIFIYFLLSLSGTLLFRLTAYHFLKIYRANGYNLHHVLIIADIFSDQIIEKLKNQKEWGFNIRGIITTSKLIRAKYGNDFKIFNDLACIKSILDNNVIDEVIYCMNEIDEDLIKKIVALCNEVGIIFRLQSAVSPLEPFDLQLKTLNSSKYLTLVDIPSNKISLIIKNMTDLYFSIAALLLLSPLFLIIGILIKLDSKGPVFFSQERIGLRGRKFRLHKFRTMVNNAEEMLNDLFVNNEMDGPAFKIKNDPRITKFGKFLRKTNLDELPQLYNVLMGEMSLIGPRPPLETEVKKYERWQLRRLSVKPGITCTWQIIPNRNDVNFERWMLMDLKYIDNWSLGKDISLLFRTFTTIFFATGR